MTAVAQGGHIFICHFFYKGVIGECSGGILFKVKHKNSLSEGFDILKQT